VDVRTATPEDALAVETVRIATWQCAYRGLVPDAYLDGLTIDARRRAAVIAEGRSTTLLCLDDGVAVGMAAFGPTRDDDLDGLELYALYVVPAAWRSGAGTALLTACGDVTSLWVLEDNAGARAFYARHGFAPDGTVKELDLGATVRDVRLLR
jgi:GNAT superfamily N-acetyltransferase